MFVYSPTQIIDTLLGVDKHWEKRKGQPVYNREEPPGKGGITFVNYTYTLLFFIY